MSKPEPPRQRTITPDSYAEWWLELDGMFIRERRFIPIGTTRDGNLIVENPEWTVWKEHSLGTE